MSGEFSENKPLTIEDLQVAHDAALRAVVRLAINNGAKKNESNREFNSTVGNLLNGMSHAVDTLTAEIKRLEAAEKAHEPATFERPPRRRPIRRRSALRSW